MDITTDMGMAVDTMVVDIMSDIEMVSMEEHCMEVDSTEDSMDLDPIIPDTMEVITTDMDLDTSSDK